MGTQVTFHDALQWLEEMCDKTETLEDQEIVEHIIEMLWQYEDLRNS